MELNALQLEIQKWSDQSLSLGCMMKSLGGEIVTLFRIVYYPEGTRDMIEGIFLPKKKKSSYDYECIKGDGGIYHFCMFGKEDIIGHPMDYGRLCYLAAMNRVELPLFEDMFAIRPDCYQSSALDRPEDLQLLVRDFLLSLSKDETKEV